MAPYIAVFNETESGPKTVEHRGIRGSDAATPTNRKF